MLKYFLAGGPIMYPLLACSIIALSVILERLIFWLKEDMKRDRKLVKQVLEFARYGDWEAIKEAVQGSKDTIVRVLVAGILHREFNMSKAMEAAASDEIKRMRKFLNVLDTIITVAPLLGILGTVTGIIQSFQMLGEAGIENPQAVTAGIAQALITTAAGLIIAIPSLFACNYFNSKIQNTTVDIEKYATSLEVVYEKLMGKNNSLNKAS
jgi:biopolymer transport protein ExbB